MFVFHQHFSSTSREKENQNQNSSDVQMVSISMLIYKRTLYIFLSPTRGREYYEASLNLPYIFSELLMFVLHQDFLSIPREENQNQMQYQCQFHCLFTNLQLFLPFTNIFLQFPETTIALSQKGEIESEPPLSAAVQVSISILKVLMGDMLTPHLSQTPEAITWLTGALTRPMDRFTTPTFHLL